MILPPKPITFAFNSSFAYKAEVISRTGGAERTPATLLTALLIPTPVPQIHTPKSALPFTTSSPTFLPKIG